MAYLQNYLKKTLNTFGKRVFANAQNFCICFLQLVMFSFLFSEWGGEELGVFTFNNENKKKQCEIEEIASNEKHFPVLQLER